MRFNLCQKRQRGSNSSLCRSKLYGAIVWKSCQWQHFLRCPWNNFFQVLYGIINEQINLIDAAYNVNIFIKCVLDRVKSTSSIRLIMELLEVHTGSSKASEYACLNLPPSTFPCCKPNCHTNCSS